MSLDKVATSSYNRIMIAVGVKDLKNRLSEFLREVHRGEVVLVTDRGRVIAELRQPTGGPAGGFERLAAAGVLSPGLPQQADVYATPPTRKRPRALSERLLDEDRGER